MLGHAYVYLSVLPLYPKLNIKRSTLIGTMRSYDGTHCQ